MASRLCKQESKPSNAEESGLDFMRKEIKGEQFCTFVRNPVYCPKIHLHGYQATKQISKLIISLSDKNILN